MLDLTHISLTCNRRRIDIESQQNESYLGLPSTITQNDRVPAESRRVLRAYFQLALSCWPTPVSRITGVRNYCNPLVALLAHPPSHSRSETGYPSHDGENGNGPAIDFKSERKRL